MQMRRTRVVPARVLLCEAVQDEEEDDTVPFPWSREVDGVHGDGGGRRKLR
jgi:hypothetical protein